MIFLTILLIYSTVSSIPWSYYYHFVLEEKHGFNKQVKIKYLLTKKKQTKTFKYMYILLF